MEYKEKVSLYIGISIPVLMVLFLAAAIYLPRFWTQPPQYNFVYAVSSYPGNDYRVDNGRIIATQYLPEKSLSKSLGNSSGLYVYDVIKNESEYISLADAQKLTLNTYAVSPDGYEIKNGSAGGSSLLFFGPSNYDYNSQYLVGHNVSIKLKLMSSPPYDGFRFLGWIIP